jgi:predicted TIM-barrel fold metal-dependent hydrolase
VTVVDAHLHLFRSVDEGLLAQGGERQAGYAGVLEEVRSVLDHGRIDRAVVASALPVAIWRSVFGPRLGEAVESHVLELAVAQNAELAEFCASEPRLALAAGADATLPASQVEHLADLVGRGGVCAIKIHPALNFVMPSDQGFRPVFEFAQEAALPVIAHGGGAAEGLYDSDIDFCAAANFVPVLEAFPDMKLLVAHCAHPYVDDLIEMAARFPNLYTDLSFVLGADLLPGDALRYAIRAFGVERVLFGTDFPYFDPEASLDRLTDCGLSDDEFTAVIGANADRVFS